MPSPALAAARERLSRALAEQAAAPARAQLLPKDARLPPAVQLPLTPSLQKVLALDLQRRVQRQEPILVAVLLREALKPLAAAHLLDPPGTPGRASFGLLLPAELAPERASHLRIVCERAAELWPTLLNHATVRLVAGVPFAVVLSQPEQVVYVNPVVLTLLAPTAGPAAAAAGTGDPERELAYRSLADCVQKVQAGCRACQSGDAAQCAAMRGTLGTQSCAEVAGDLTKLGTLCEERALLIGSVADCLRRLDVGCAAGRASPRCHELIDTCIANPATEASRADGSAEEPPPSAGGCSDCTCSQGCAEACGSFGRQTCRPLGEGCSDQAGKSCTEACNDCNSECNRSCTGSCNSCTQFQRDCNNNCRAASGGCTSCSQSCQSCNSDCNRNCNDCNHSCGQCNNDCNQCNSDCNRCNSDCNQCNSDCNQCNSDCNQCNSGCNDCNSSGCNDCNGSGCNNDCGGSGCNNQCSTVPSSGYPRFPTPPGPADPPPPMARLLVGARGAVSLLLPPILFLWWRRRLRPSAATTPEAPR